MYMYGERGHGELKERLEADAPLSSLESIQIGASALSVSSEYGVVSSEE